VVLKNTSVVLKLTPVSCNILYTDDDSYWNICWLDIHYLTGETKVVAAGICLVSQFSLRGSGLATTGAIALARALQHNKSLEMLKWVDNWVSSYQKIWCECWILQHKHLAVIIFFTFMLSVYTDAYWQHMSVLGHTLYNIYFGYLYQFWSTLFHSLELNKIGSDGTTALANCLEVNQSLKMLK